MILRNDIRRGDVCPDSTAAVLNRIRRTRGTGTFVMDALDAGLIEELIACGLCSSKELPLLACLDADGDWFTVTTEGVYVSREESVTAIPLDTIEEIEPADTTNEVRGACLPEEYRYLGLVTAAGEHHMLRTEPGLSFYGVHNMLLWLVTARRELRTQNAG